ncbi:MAG: DNA double-strand break repair nuclease NurA, partial [Candidatus Binatia bacterium]
MTDQDTTTRAPFTDLPASLLADVLAQSEIVSSLLLAEIGAAQSNRIAFRNQLEARGMILRESDLGVPLPPTTCGTDGSYAIERMLTADLAVAAAVAVEGLTPPQETRFWPEPRHTVFVSAEPHHEETPTILRAVMLGRELSLAIEAPHDLVLLDMTLTLPLIYFNQALNAAPTASG